MYKFKCLIHKKYQSTNPKKKTKLQLPIFSTKKTSTTNFKTHMLDHNSVSKRNVGSQFTNIYTKVYN